MKRILILVVLVGIAGVAGIVRSGTNSGDFDRFVSHNSQGEAVRDEIRKTHQLQPGASVEVANINGSVKIETSESATAEILVERTGSSQEVLNRRTILVEADNNSLRIRGAKGDVGLLAKFFGSSPSEKVTLKLPRQISLHTKGVNGSVTIGDVDGDVEVNGINGGVQVAGTSGVAEFKGINGNISVGVKKVNNQGFTLSGINGNIELQLWPGLNADLSARGMNGRVYSDTSDIQLDKEKHGKYSARIGLGGSPITVKGINGNVRLTRSGVPTDAAEADSAGKSH